MTHEEIEARLEELERGNREVFRNYAQHDPNPEIRFREGTEWLEVPVQLSIPAGSTCCVMFHVG